MGRIAKAIALLFRLCNFFFDCLQTWQYTGGGGMGSLAASLIAWWQGLPAWSIAAIVVLVGIAVPVGRFGVRNRLDSRIGLR